MEKKEHIIVGDHEHVFIKLYIDVLVKKCLVPPSKLLLVSPSCGESREPLLDVDVVSYQHCDTKILNDCCSVTAISLNTKNASVLKKLIVENHAAEKIAIHLTDDEVARWINVKNKHGELVVASEALFDEDCLFVINNVNTLIAPEPYFKEKMDHLLPDKTYRYVDARDPFKSLPSREWEMFKSLHQSESITVRENNICIGAKRGVFSLIDILKMISAFKKEGLVPKNKIILFTYKKKKHLRVIIDLYLGMLRHIYKCNVDIAYPIATTPIAYNAILASCHYLILQGRGSMSSARSYLSLGNGVVCVEANSANEKELKFAEGVDVISYKTWHDLALAIKNNSIDAAKNQAIINQAFNRKYAVLREFYSG